jgi:hypothetical protein
MRSKATNVQGMKSEGKRPPGRPRHRWDNNIEMDLKEMRCEKLYWIHAAQNSVGAVVNTRMNMWYHTIAKISKQIPIQTILVHIVLNASRRSKSSRCSCANYRLRATIWLYAEIDSIDRYYVRLFLVVL